jgi:hypothetical protein
MIVEYSKMSQSQLEDDVWYSLYLDSKVKAGMLKMATVGRRKKRFYERVLKPGEYKILSNV